MPKKDKGEKEIRKFIRFIVVLFILIIIILLFMDDTGDMINTRVFGEKLCASVNLTYDHRKLVNPYTNIMGFDRVPIIYCKLNTTREKQLTESIVYLKNG